jgi:hypothetical protein
MTLSSTRGKVNMIFDLPVASYQLEGQLCELPQVVSRHLAMLVVVGQRHGRDLPKIKYSEKCMAFQRIFIVVIVLSIFFLPVFEVILAFQIEGMLLYLSVPVQITYKDTLFTKNVTYLC